MQVTKFSDYALRLLIHLAVTPEQRQSVRQIADNHDISFNHLSKVAQWLATEGYVKAVRGRGGGMTLGRSAEEISIGALLRKSESGSALVECMRDDGGACRLTPACGLAPFLSRAQEAFFAALDDTTLADVVAGHPGMRNLVAALSQPAV
ncbi:MAG: Rrf2 family transcriptional regulator [Pseudomonadota bacterium]